VGKKKDIIDVPFPCAKGTRPPEKKKGNKEGAGPGNRKRGRVRAPAGECREKKEGGRTQIFRGRGKGGGIDT